MKTWCRALLVYRALSFFIRVRTRTRRVLKFEREDTDNMPEKIPDEAYVSKIAVLRETNLQDCNPAQIGSFFIF